VVVAVISLLVTILMPALERTRELGRRAVCASNLRNIMTAHYLYAEEGNEALPAQHTNMVGHRVFHRMYQVWNDLEWKVSVPPWDGPVGANRVVMRDLLSGEVLFCPSLTGNWHRSGDNAAGDEDHPNYRFQPDHGRWYNANIHYNRRLQDDEREKPFVRVFDLPPGQSFLVDIFADGRIEASHGTGANAARVDGSVRFVHDQDDPPILRRIWPGIHTFPDRDAPRHEFWDFVDGH
jgi:prepilin-type processing-associated H-X9-DG protein